MPQDRPAPGSDRILIARLSGLAQRHARWGGLSEDERAAGAAELRELAGDRPELLAHVAGLALGAAQGNGREYEARGQAIADLCRLAGADESLIPQWAEEGKRRAAARPMPPLSTPGPRAPQRP
jgi:hypothetical protein